MLKVYRITYIKEKKMENNCLFDAGKNKEKENAVIEQVEQVFWYFTRYFMWVFVFLMAIAGAFFYVQKNIF